MHAVASVTKKLCMILSFHMKLTSYRQSTMKGNSYILGMNVDDIFVYILYLMHNQTVKSNIKRFVTILLSTMIIQGLGFCYSKILKIWRNEVRFIFSYARRRLYMPWSTSEGLFLLVKS